MCVRGKLKSFYSWVRNARSLAAIVSARDSHPTDSHIRVHHDEYIRVHLIAMVVARKVVKEASVMQ